MILTYNYLCLPQGTLSVAELLGSQTTKNEAEIQKTIEITGVSTLSVSNEKKLSSFVMSAFNVIAEQSEEVFEGIDAILVVSQSYDRRIPTISTQLQGQLNAAADTFCLDMTDGCAGYIKACALANMLLSQGRKKVVIVAGDLNSLMTSDADVSTRILFGDGVSISIFEQSQDPFNYQLFNDGANAKHIVCQVDAPVMEMNGFEVFRFTRNVVPNLIKTYLDQHQLTKEHFDYVGYHQASNLIVSTLSKSTGISNQEGDNFNCGDIGNLGAGSIGAWMAKSNIKQASRSRMMAIGYGAGLSWGLCDFYLQLKRNEVIYVEN